MLSSLLLVASLKIPIASYHIDRQPSSGPIREWQEKNLGVLVEPRLGWHIGIYRNSYDKNSVVVLKNISVFRNNFGVRFGAASNYPRGTIPVGYAYVSYGAIEVGYAPSLAGGVLLLSVDVKWK